MDLIEAQNSFYVCYAKDDEQLAVTIIGEIAEDLDIRYGLWQYHLIGDESVYFESVVVPSVEKAGFVLLLLSRSSENDELVIKTQELCHNLNKRLIPVKICNGRLKLKSFSFRTEIVDYCDRPQKLDLLEQMHSWLGFAKVYPWSDVKFCSGCGRKIKTKASFCKWCGKHFVENAERHCPKCGSPLKVEANFCNVCGKKL